MKYKTFLYFLIKPGFYVPAGLPKENEGAAVAGVPPVKEAGLPPAAAAPKSEGFAAPPVSPPGLKEKPPDAGCDAPGVACALPKMPGLLAAGVLDAPPNSVDPELAAPPPKREEVAPGVLEPEFAALLLLAPPKRFEPGVAAPPNKGLFGVLLLLLPKVKAMMGGYAASPGSQSDIYQGCAGAELFTYVVRGYT